MGGFREANKRKSSFNLKESSTHKKTVPFAFYFVNQNSFQTSSVICLNWNGCKMRDEHGTVTSHCDWSNLCQNCRPLVVKIRMRPTNFECESTKVSVRFLTCFRAPIFSIRCHLKYLNSSSSAKQTKVSYLWSNVFCFSFIVIVIGVEKKSLLFVSDDECPKCATVIFIFVSFPSSTDHNVVVRWKSPRVARSARFAIQKCFTQLLEIFEWRFGSFEMFWLRSSRTSTRWKHQSSENSSRNQFARLCAIISMRRMLHCLSKQPAVMQQTRRAW
jgi:hypothetical protein